VKITGDPERDCKVGKPAAIETAVERQFVHFLLTDTCKYANYFETNFAHQ